MLPSLPIAWVDAFTDAPFSGNPAGVVLVDEAGSLDEATMQSLAFELGIAETAFVEPSDDPHTFGLRWFSPATEIDLCGHATLASAHALRQAGAVDGESALTFHTRSGPLHAAFVDGGRISLNFPTDVLADVPLPEAVADQWPADEVAYSGQTSFFAFVALCHAAAVRDYRPDLAAIAAVGTKALLLTAPANDGAPQPGDDYVLRVFGPNVGIDEDPGTGSAQCSAGPYWASHLGKSGEELVARQLSPRGALLHVRPEGERVHIAGAATTILTGRLC